MTMWSRLFGKDKGHEYSRSSLKHFAFRMHNEDARKATRLGIGCAPHLKDWLEVRTLEIAAASEEEALRKVRGKYRQEDGFVIDSITPK